MLLRFDPFREIDRLTQQAFGTVGRTGFMPLDAYRQDGRFVAQLDLPGVNPASIDLTVEKNVLTVTAQRQWTRSEDQQVVAAERPHGTFSRQLFLGEALDADGISASYEDGVLTVTLPVAEQANARKVEITTGGGQPKAIQTGADTESAAA